MSAVTAAPVTDARRVLRTALAQHLRSYPSLQLVDRDRLAVAILDAEGSVVWATERTPVANLHELHGQTRALLGDWRAGDVVIASDPYSGGRTVKDHVLLLALVTPDETTLGTVAILAPFFDVGGKQMGNDLPDALDLFAEGVRTTPVRVQRDGSPDERMLDQLALNSRVPALVRADIAAMIAVASNLAPAAQELLAGPAAADAIDSSESAVRRLLGRDLQLKLEANVPGADGASVALSLTIADGHLVVDLTGSSDQVTTYHNATLPTSTSAVLDAVRDTAGCALNAGVARAVTVDAPEGSIVNCKFPAAVGGCAVVADVVRRLVFDALSKEAGNSPVREGEITDDH